MELYDTPFLPFASLSHHSLQPNVWLVYHATGTPTQPQGSRLLERTPVTDIHCQVPECSLLHIRGEPLTWPLTFARPFPTILTAVLGGKTLVGSFFSVSFFFFFCFLVSFFPSHI